jgi:pimeloyl-ACP methyl ester carboxylesterase
MDLTATSRYADSGLPLWREAFAGLDWLSLRFSPVYSGHGIERGRGEAVVLVPGLFAADATMIELHRWLARTGYTPYESGIGVNALPSDTLIARLIATIDRAYAETGAPVRLVGHSLGGLLARGAALRRPGRVAQVITLGSPVQGLGAHPAALAAAKLVHDEDIDACLVSLQRPLPASIAETNVYSKSDGVVDWRTCRRGDATAVEVRGSHTGLIANAEVYGVIAAALAAQSARDDLRRSAVAISLEARSGVPSSGAKTSRLAA